MLEHQVLAAVIQIVCSRSLCVVPSVPFVPPSRARLHA